MVMIGLSPNVGRVRHGGRWRQPGFGRPDAAIVAGSVLPVLILGQNGRIFQLLIADTFDRPGRGDTCLDYCDRPSAG
jgi:hypothetical protein